MNTGEGERLRLQLLGRMRGHLSRRRAPRVILSGIMLATAVAGFLASMAMLKLGLNRMWLRYPLAVLVAWETFLMLVRWWAERERESIRVDEELARIEPRADDKVEVKRSVWQGRAPETRVHRHRWLDWLDFPGFDAADAEGCLVFLAVGLLVVLAVGAVVTISGLFLEAETVLAEVLLDTVLVSAFYRQLRRKDSDWWMNGTVRHTIWPVLATMGCLIIIGLLFQHYAPEAHSIGAVWRHWRASPG